VFRLAFVLVVVASGCTCRPAAKPVLEPLEAGLPRQGQWRAGFSLVDLDGDGRVDLLHGPARKGARRPNAWRSAGDGTFTPLTVAWPELAWDYGDAIALNADQLVFGVHLGAALAMTRVDGGWQDDSAGLPTEGFSSRALAVGDWTGDGRPDVLALSDGPRPGVPGFKGLGVRVFERGAEGWRVSPVREDDRRFGDDLVVADFDGDGRVDVATASHAVGEARLVDFGGGARPVQPLPLPPRAVVRALAAADVDADGRAELFLVATVPGVDRFSSELWRFDLEGETWKGKALHSQPVEQWALAAGDVTGDGTVDLISGDDDGVLRVWSSGVGPVTLMATPAWRAGCRVTHLEVGALDARPGLEVVASFAFEDAPERCPSQGGLEVSRWR
jgi:hypothetical protein